MNKANYDILRQLIDDPTMTQRELSTTCAYSLGKVNKSLFELKQLGYLNEDLSVTEKTLKELESKKPKNAVILAAGYGLRMIPLNLDMPKGLLRVKGETLIERLINQLREVGVQEIVIVVGHLKEAYSFLMDDEDITLIVNRGYSSKNNLHSLYRALPYLGNSYIVPCDLRFKNNPFSTKELYSWYGMTAQPKNNSLIRVNSKGELQRIKNSEIGQTMVGVSYLLSEDLGWILPNMEKLVESEKYDHVFWEESFVIEKDQRLWAKVFDKDEVFEFTSLKDLQFWQDDEDDFGNPAIEMITSLLKVSPSEIEEIRPMESGMTNRSFLFTCRGERYIMRVPGEGTEMLIDRTKEKAVYSVLEQAGLSKELVYIDEKSGYKLTRMLPRVRVCDPKNIDDITRCMKLLKDFHDKKLVVDHYFDVYEQLEYYEKLWGGVPSVYRDYPIIKARIYELKEFIEDHVDRQTLCHIDAVPDNFLFYREGDDENEALTMIDWEYAAMQDPHIDLAMFSIYSTYSQQEIDRIIDLYFDGQCRSATRIKIYAYVSLCGLLWSNWCEYKRLLGVDFGQYALEQYRYAKIYYQKVIESVTYQKWKKRKEGEA